MTPSIQSIPLLMSIGNAITFKPTAGDLAGLIRGAKITFENDIMEPYEMWPEIDRFTYAGGVTIEVKTDYHDFEIMTKVVFDIVVETNAGIDIETRGRYEYYVAVKSVGKLIVCGKDVMGTYTQRADNAFVGQLTGLIEREVA